jgi:hypothetical protein
MTGRTQELKAATTSIGRAEDNTFAIVDASVSSHHCEVLLRGSEVFVRDLNSTNGTFIDGERITEGALKAGQVLQVGQIGMRLEPNAPVAPAKKPLDRTTVIPSGVSTDELDQVLRLGGFNARGTGFSKKDDKVNHIFIAVVVVVAVGIAALLLYVFTIAGK